VNDKTCNSLVTFRRDSPDSQALGDIDLSAESVITIQPDGRIHLFGITRAAVEVLATIPCADPVMRRRLERMLAAGNAVLPGSPDSPSLKEAL
jgi:hypothetical protein